jgi:hypothetical protein
VKALSVGGSSIVDCAYDHLCDVVCVDVVNGFEPEVRQHQRVA